MKVSVEKLPSSEAVLDVEVSWDEMEKASDKAFKKLVQKVDIQGFRRGKAPRSLVERRLGKEYIYQEGLDDLISEAYRNALKEYELIPITQPKLDAPTFEMGQPYHFSLTVPIVTPVELGDYRSLHFERAEDEVTSEEVEREIESQRQRLAEWEEVERPANYGDRVTMDLKLTSGDQSISDLKDNPFELTQERHGLFTGLDEEVVGQEAGASKSFTTTIPTDYGNEKLAGQPANYEVTLHKVEEKHLPELDDALAEKVSQGEFTNLEDLRKAISDDILENKKRQSRDKLRDEVINAVIEQSHFSIHPLLIDEEAEEMLHQFTHMLERQRMSLDQYLKLVNKSRDEYLQDLKPDAEQRVKRSLVLDEVVKQEEIGISPEEIESIFQAYAQAGQELPRTEGQIRAVAASYLREKALNRLIELTTDPDPADVATEDAEAASEANASEAAQVAAEVANEEHNDSVGTEVSITPPSDESVTEKQM